MKQIIVIFWCWLPFVSFAQDNRAGEIEFGFRNTYSLFSAENSLGFGAGGQFRIRLGDQLNTEWFADLVKNNIDNLGSRTDSHIGWSVMFYPKWYDTKITPYFLAGHCFDYTKVIGFETSLSESQRVVRWSSAVQAGIGTSWNFSERVNFSFSGQYMLHLGSDVHAEVEKLNGLDQLHVIKEHQTGLEGHLLLTLSMNILIFDAW